jgi:hypothetical protein
MFIIFLKIYIFKQLTERLLDGLGLLVYSRELENTCRKFH